MDLQQIVSDIVFWMMVPLGLLRDALLLLGMVPIMAVGVPLVIIPRLLNPQPGNELDIRELPNFLSLAGQGVLLAWSVTPPFCWLLWGWRFVMLVIVNLCSLLPDELKLWPRDWRVSYPGDPAKPVKTKTFYVNGVCCNRHWLKVNCKTLEAYLGYQVQGIYNETYGLLMDLVECLLQRNLHFATESVMHAAVLVEDALLTGVPVNLIGHSQGGIIVGLVVTYLVRKYSQSNPKLLGRLTVWTFASAAAEFPAPGLAEVKHYANQFDLGARLGVLASHFSIPAVGGHGNPAYTDGIFVHWGTWGHLLSTFYTFARPSVYTPLSGGSPSPF